MSDNTYTFDFPMPRTHTGVLLGNARLGAMVWGQENILRITLGRADLWDHRGGLHWTDNQAYDKIRDCLERNDAEEIARLFAVDSDPKLPCNPSVMPIGRYNLVFPEDVRVKTADLDLHKAQLTISLQQGAALHRLTIFMDTFTPVLAVALPPELADPQIQPLPAWEFVGEYLRSKGFVPPQTIDEDDLCGWQQPLPADPEMIALCRKSDATLEFTACIAAADESAREVANKLFAAVDREGLDNLRRRTESWWENYWQRVPSLNLPNPKLQFLYDYGMYKFAGLTAPHGVPATLQGPWIEEYQMPPWSSDYHFNINVQMCYWPAYHGNCLEHLRPLFDLIHSWMPQLHRNAKVLIGIDDGVMLPHAVDDRCTCMGGMWTGTIDHGCTAWVAQMMYRYYRYTRDTEFLRDQAYPFMRGALRVYEEMLEPDDEGHLVLPVSVSPEYRGGAMNAWGRNASFQLACIHRLCEDLQDAAAELGEKSEPAWSEIQTKVPRACLIDSGHGDKQIALWEGTPLEESHRHHSHLAGITPFDIFTEDDPGIDVVHKSIAHWIKMGMGLWSGWCVPWASMIHTRLGNAEDAELWIEVWQRLFTNEGHGTLHDVAFSGFSLTGKGAVTPDEPPTNEKMQMDAGMSCVTAIQEMLLHEERGVTVLFKGAPKAWKNVGFQSMATDGGFLVSADRISGDVGPVSIESPHGGNLRLANPWPNQTATATYPDGRQEPLGGPTLEIETKPGETVILRGA